MSDTIAPVTITVTDRKTGKRRTEPLAVRMPESFAIIRELVFASTPKPTDVTRPYIGAAMLALCCPAMTGMLLAAKIDYDDFDANPLKFGRKVYNWLHQDDVGDADLSRNFYILQAALLDAGWPTKKEVDSELGKSKGSAAPATA